MTRTLNLTPEEIAKYKLRELESNSEDIPNENLVISRFGMYFGFEAVIAVLNNEIDTDTMFWLMEGAERVEEINRYENTKMALYANLASKAKDPKKAFDRLMKEQKNKMTGRKIK